MGSRGTMSAANPEMAQACFAFFVELIHAAQLSLSLGLLFFLLDTITALHKSLASLGTPKHRHKLSQPRLCQMPK